MSKTVVSSDNAPAAIGPYSPGIQAGNMVFLSGQLGIDPATGKMPEGVEAQAKQSLANVEALLTAAGATFADVVKTTVYLADIADFAAVNEIYSSKFEAPFPAPRLPPFRLAVWSRSRSSPLSKALATTKHDMQKDPAARASCRVFCQLTDRLWSRASFCSLAFLADFLQVAVDAGL